MDLVGELARQLQLPENAARGLAGQVLALIEGLVRERVSYGLAARLTDAVPEAARWQRSAPTLPPGALSSRPSEPVTERTEFHEVLERFRLPPKVLPAVARLTLQFLAARLDDRHFTQIDAVVRAELGGHAP
ncbi:MAG: hypothetical protein ACOZQL_38290 [Myxococcota bacterium]